MNLPRYISGNLQLKIVSVVMASLLWLYVMAGKDVEKRVQIPVIFANLDDSLTVIDKPPAVLDVELKGDRLSLLSLSEESLQLVLDMKGVHEGAVSFTNLEKSLIPDSRVRVTRIHPARIDISLARVASEKPAR